MTTTKVDLATEVLEELGVLGVGQTASAEDSQKVQSVIEKVHAEYETEGRVTWGVDEIPDNVADPLRVIVAERLLEVFEIEPERAERIRGKQPASVVRFIKQVVNTYGGEPVKAQYF
jgi:hypothetical protein